MAKFIELTYKDKIRKVYINIEHIGDIIEINERHYNGEEKKLTNVGVTTHNNGGWLVLESAEQILKLINAK